MATPDYDKTDGAPPREIHVEDKKTNWLAWAALIAGLLALLLALSRCDNDEGTVVPPANVADPLAEQAVAPTPALAFTSGLGGYLAGTEALPRTFVFEKLNFETAKSDIRPADQAEINSIVAALKQHANARIRVVGFADARGDSGANAQLGDARASNVKAALVAGGIAAERIETGSGGETDPVDSNATSTGQAENRRTELVVLQR